MNLAEMNFSEIKHGIKVISAVNTPGVIKECRPEGTSAEKERYDTIVIDWENGKTSYVYHMQAEYITLAE